MENDFEVIGMDKASHMDQFVNNIAQCSCASSITRYNEAMGRVYNETTYTCFHAPRQASGLDLAMDVVLQLGEAIVDGGSTNTSQTNTSNFNSLQTYKNNVNYLHTQQVCPEILLLAEEDYAEDGYLYRKSDGQSFLSRRSVARAVYASKFINFRNNLTMRWSETVVTTGIIEDSRPTPGVIPLDVGEYRYRITMSTSGIGSVLVTRRTAKGKAETLGLSGLSIIDRFEGQFCAQEETSIVFTIRDPSKKVRGIFQVELEQGEHDIGTVAISGPDSVGLRVTVKEPLQIFGQVTASVKDTISVTGSVSATVSNTIRAVVEGSNNATAPIWISEHQPFQTGEGWVKDLTQEGIEPNPGPFVDLEELMALVNEFDSHDSGFDSVYYSRAMMYLVWVDLNVPHWRLGLTHEEAGLHAAYVLDVGIGEVEYYIAARTVCENNGDYVRWNVMWELADGVETSLTQGYVLLRASGYDHVECWNILRDLFICRRQPRSSDRLLANRAMHAYNGNPLSETMEDVDRAPSIDDMLKTTAVRDTFDPRVLVSLNEIGTRALSSTMGDDTDVGSVGVVSNTTQSNLYVGARTMCPHPWSCLYPLGFVTDKHVEGATQRTVGDVGGYAFNGTCPRVNKARTIPGIPVSYKATTFAADVQADVENSKAFRLGARDVTAQGFLRLDVIDVVGQSAVGNDITESMMLKGHLRASIDKFSVTRFNEIPWTVFQAFDPFIRPFARYNNGTASDSEANVNKFMIDLGRISVDHPWLWQTGHGTNMPEPHYFFPFTAPADQGILRFHVSVDTVPYSCRETAVFVPTWLCNLQEDPSLTLAILVMLIAPWPYGIHSFHRHAHFNDVEHGEPIDKRGVQDPRQTLNIELADVEDCDDDCEHSLNADGDSSTTDTPPGGSGTADAAAADKTNKGKGDADKIWWPPATTRLWSQTMFAFFQSYVSIDGLREIDLVLPRGSVDTQASGTAKNSAFIIPRWGNQTVDPVKYPAKGVLTFFNPVAPAAGSFPLVPYLLGWDSEFGQPAITRVLKALAEQFNARDIYSHSLEMAVNLSWRSDHLLYDQSFRPGRADKVGEGGGHSGVYAVPGDLAEPVSLHLGIAPLARPVSKFIAQERSDTFTLAMVDGYPYNSWPMIISVPTFVCSSFMSRNWNRVILGLSTVSRSGEATPGYSGLAPLLESGYQGVLMEQMVAGAISIAWNVSHQSTGYAANALSRSWSPAGGYQGVILHLESFWGPGSGHQSWSPGTCYQVLTSIMAFCFDRQFTTAEGGGASLSVFSRWLRPERFASVIAWDKGGTRLLGAAGRVVSKISSPVSLPDIIIQYYTFQLPKHMCSFVPMDRMQGNFGYGPAQGLEISGTYTGEFSAYCKPSDNIRAAEMNEEFDASDELMWNNRLMLYTGLAKPKSWDGSTLETGVVEHHWGGLDRWRAWPSGVQVVDITNRTTVLSNTCSNPTMWRTGLRIYYTLLAQEQFEVAKGLVRAFKRMSPLNADFWNTQGIVRNTIRGFTNSDKPKLGRFGRANLGFSLLALEDQMSVAQTTDTTPGAAQRISQNEEVEQAAEII